MAKSPITPSVEQWLKLNHKRYTHKELAAHIGCCIETVRRALMRLELEVIYGAKYQRRQPPKKWSRPCSVCGCKKSRPKFQYRCNACHDRERDQDSFVGAGRLKRTLTEEALCPDRNVKVTLMSESWRVG